LVDITLDATNWRAEQAIRSALVIRKASVAARLWYKELRNRQAPESESDEAVVCGQPSRVHRSVCAFSSSIDACR
jgi:hypothetical protein